MKSYNPYNFVSNCCHSFNYFNGNNVYCSKCGKIVKNIKDDESLTVHVKFNVNDQNEENNISGDIVNNFKHQAKRYAHDPTCELINKECPKCQHKYCRYLRDPQDNLIFVCESCRYVFN